MSEENTAVATKYRLLFLTKELRLFPVVQIIGNKITNQKTVFTLLRKRGISACFDRNSCQSTSGIFSLNGVK